MKRLITFMTLIAAEMPSQAEIHIVNNIPDGLAAVIFETGKKSVVVNSATFSAAGCAPVRQVLRNGNTVVTSEISLPMGSASGTGGSFTLDFNPPLVVKPHSNLTLTNGDQTCLSNIMVQTK